MENTIFAQLDEEALNKSLDALLDEHFTADGLEKSIDIAGDSETKADAVVNKAPKGQNDDARGAGRPKAISDVPATDTDGKRAGTFDDDISEKAKEEDTDEVKKQIKSVDQTSVAGHSGGKAKAPATAPFKKSLDDAEVAEFLAWKASQVSDVNEGLAKSLTATLEPMQKAFAAMQARIESQEALLKSIAKTPLPSKSIAGIEQLQKSADPTTLAPQAFTKSQKLDAAEALAKGGAFPMDVVIELENTNAVYNSDHRSAIENYLINNN